MKLLLTFLMSFTLVAAYSQDYDFKVEKLKYAKYNSYTESYDDDVNVTYPTNMHIRYINGIFLVTDEANSNYRVDGILKEYGDNCNAYSATDEKNRNVTIILCSKKNEGILTIIYDKVYYFAYYIK